MQISTKLSLFGSLIIGMLVSGASTSYADSVAPKPVHKEGNISTMNGELVEVGVHNKYDYSFKRFNIASNPIGLLYGLYDLQASYALNSIVALRADVAVFNSPDSQKKTSYKASVSAAIYLKHMYRGIYLEPGLVAHAFEDKYGSTSKRHIAVGPQSLIGYHWIWDSGLNAAIAFGGGRDLKAKDDQEKIFANGYFRIGYAF